MIYTELMHIFEANVKEAKTHKNDNAIVYALECCCKNPPDCIQCSYKGKCNKVDCYDCLKRDALHLIERLKAQIKELEES